MRFPSREIVELVFMDDIQAPPAGTKGTVRGVDDIGSNMVSWDNGSSLSVAYGEDSCRRISDERKNKGTNSCNQKYRNHKYV